MGRKSVLLVDTARVCSNQKGICLWAVLLCLCCHAASHLEHLSQDVALQTLSLFLVESGAECQCQGRAMERTEMA